MNNSKYTCVWFNFEDLGVPGWCPVSTFESELMLTSAQALLEQHSTAACETWRDTSARQLRVRARRNQITDHWVCQALLTTAVTGLLGHAVPEVKIQD